MLGQARARRNIQRLVQQALGLVKAQLAILLDRLSVQQRDLADRRVLLARRRPCQALRQRRGRQRQHQRDHCCERNPARHHPH
jgi:hypothetical protein